MEPICILDIQEWHSDENGIHRLPPYIVAIFPNYVNIFNIQFAKKTRKYYKGNRDLQIAKLSQFVEVVNAKKKGKNHCRVGRNVYKWTEVLSENSHCKLDYSGNIKKPPSKPNEHENGPVFQLHPDTNIIMLSNYKEVYILDIKYNNGKPFFVAICNRYVDTSCISFSKSTMSYFRNRDFKVVSGPIWNRIVSLCKRKMYRAIDGPDYYVWRELKNEEREHIKLTLTGKEAENIQRQKALQNQKSKQVQKPTPKKVFNLDMILYVYVNYPVKYLHNYKTETVHAGILCIDGEIRYIEAYYCQE